MSYERDIIDTVRDPLLVLDANLAVMAASRCFYASFSTTPERTIGRKIYNLGNRDGGAGEGDSKGDGEWDIPALRTLLEEILPEESHFDDFAVEHTFPPPIGHRSMILNARRVSGTGTERGTSPGLILLAIEDVTLRRAAEALAKVNQIALEVTLRSIGDGVIATDNQARVTYLNPVAEVLTGWTMAEATHGSTGVAGGAGGRPLLEVFNIVNEESRLPVECPVNKALRLGTIAGLTNHTVLIRRDGTEVHIDDIAAPIELPPAPCASGMSGTKGEVIGVVMVFRDIGERREVARAIQASEVRYRRLFESAHDGILILDPKTRKITDANPYMEELLDTPVADLVGKELFEIGLLKDQEESRQAFQRLLKAGQIRYENLPLETRMGRRRDVEFVSNLYQEGSVALIQCNIRDITERVIHTREREQLLARERVAHEQAELANRSKDIFMATLAHELRTPLNAILGWAVMLRSRTSPDGKPIAADIDHGLAIIERNARAQGKLMEDVLDVSRVVSGKFELDLCSCDLAGIAFAAADAVRPAALAKEITLNTASIRRRILNRSRSRAMPPG